MSARFERDPGNVEALAGVGAVDAVVAYGYMTDNPAVIAAAAEANLAKVLALAPNHAFAHRLMGFLLCMSNRAERGLEELDRALAIDPNMARSHDVKGLTKISLGRAEETEAHVLEAFRLRPRDGFVSHWFFHIGSAKSYLGEHEAAVGWLRKSVDANRNSPWPYFFLAANPQEGRVR